MKGAVTPPYSERTAATAEASALPTRVKGGWAKSCSDEPGQEHLVGRARQDRAPQDDREVGDPVPRRSPDRLRDARESAHLEAAVGLPGRAHADQCQVRAVD